MTIQAAVTAAAPGDKVQVCPGTYSEQVRITDKDKLKLESQKKEQAIIKFPPVTTPPNALVHIKDSDDVTVKGFTITGPYTSGGCSPFTESHEGVFVDDSFDAKIEHNRITLIKDSVPALYGCQDGYPVVIGDSFASDPAIGSATLAHNVIDEYQKTAVYVDGEGSFADVNHNVIRAAEDVQGQVAPNGVVITLGAGAKIDHNEISENKFAPPPGHPDEDDAGTGILLDAPEVGGVKVDHNEVFDNDDGISSYDSDNQTIDDNISYDNVKYDGLFFDENSTGNEVKDNRAFNNAEHDCHDDSVDGGTAGTGNTWKGNRGDTQTPPGICKPN